MASLYSTVFRNTGFLFAADVFYRLLSFVLFLFIAYSLGASGLGDYSFIFAFAGLFIVVNDIGLSTLFVRETSRDLSKSSYFLGNVLFLKILFGILAAVLTMAAISFSDVSSDVAISVYVVAVALFFMGMKDLFFAVFQAHQKMGFIALARSLEIIVVFSVAFMAIQAGLGVLGIAFAFLAAYLVVLVLSAVAVAKIVRLALIFDFGFQKKLLKSSLPFWFTTVFTVIYFRIDTVMIGLIRDSVEVGLYSASFRMLDALYFVPATVITAIFPAMSQMHLRKELLKSLYRKAFYYLLVLAVPMGVGVTILAPRIFSFMYGSEFEGAHVALQVLIWAEVAIFLSSVTGYLMNAVNRPLVFTYTAAFAALLNVVLNLLFIPVFGYLGAAITTLMTEAFIFASLVFFSHKLGLSFNFLRPAVKPLVASAVMAGSILAMLGMHILVIVPLAGIVYFGVLFAIKGIEKDELEIIRQILKNPFSFFR